MAASSAMAESLPGLGEIGEDRLLDGRLTLLQPKKGHRAGTDAVLLAASVPHLPEGRLVDFGAGVGTVGLVAALLQPGLEVTLIERDPELAELARRNVLGNGLGARARVVSGDVTQRGGNGLEPGGFACVAMNPPFFPADETRASPVPNRRAAHVAEGPLADWVKAARRLLAPRGHLVVIHRAEAVAEICAALSVGFGALTLRPVHGLADRPAIRVIARAQLGSRAAPCLLPPLVLSEADGRFTQASEAVHRGRARL